MRKRKHAALDDVAFNGDNSASSDSRTLRALPRRGRSREIAAEPEDGVDTAVTAGDADFAAHARPLARRDAVSEVTDIPVAALHVTSACVPNPTSKRRRVGNTLSAPLNPDGCTLRDQTSADDSGNDNQNTSPVPPAQSCGNCGRTKTSSRWRRSRLIAVKICAACYAYEGRNSKCRPSVVRTDGEHTSPAPPAQSCGNCGSTATSRWTKSKLLLTKICHPCYQHEKKYSKCRPLPAARPSSQPSSQCCGNCGTHTSSKNQWADSNLLIGQILCRPCFEYEKQHSKCRPLSLIQRARNRPHIVSECANCRSKTTSDSWCSSVVHPASILCHTCYTYEKRHGKARPESLYLYQRPPRPQPQPRTKCHNCGEKKPREWRTDGEGNTVCDECGIYYLANGFARPLSKEDIRKRRKCMQREQRRNASARDTVNTKPASPSTAPPDGCSNCKSMTTKGKYWCSSRLGPGRVCQACYTYERKNDQPRPISVIQRVRLHPGPGGCSNCAVQSTRQWGRSVLTPGWILCKACSRYEERNKCHRPQRLWKDV